MDKWYDRGITFAFDLFKMMALYWGMKFFLGKPQNEKFSTFLLHEGEWSPQATKMTFNVWLVPHTKLPYIWRVIMTIYIFLGWTVPLSKI